MYEINQSPVIVNAYKGYQGQDPALSKFIFIGLDANFSSEHSSEDLMVLNNYLNNGVDFWESNGIHHPFLLPSFRNVQGYKYHKNFSKLQLGTDYAKYVTFLELLNVPTTGNTSKNKKKFKELMDLNHLKYVELILLNENISKKVFIPVGVYRFIQNIKKRDNIFTWLPEVDKIEKNKLLQIFNNDNLELCIITHFSNSISNKHILEIREKIIN